MVKKEILHIVVIAFGLYFFMTFLFSISGVGYAISMKEMEQISRGSQILWASLNSILLLVLAFIFLLKNDFIIDLLISKENAESAGLNGAESAIGRLSFWIRLIGLYYFVSAFSSVLAQLPSIFSFKFGYTSQSFWWNQTGSHLIALLVSVVLVLKSEKIERILNKIDNSDAQPGSSL